MTARGVRRVLAVGLVAVVALLGGGAAGIGPAVADDAASTGGTLYLADANTLDDVPVGQALHWDQAVTALPAPGDQTNKLVAPKGTQSVVSFVGPVGHESDPASWDATAPWDFTAPGQWLADVTPYHLIVPGTGTPSGTKATAATSGDYSLGIAYLADNGTRVVPGGLYFVHIHLTGDADPSKASYTWQPVQVAPTAATGSSGSGARTAVGLGVAAGVVAIAALAGGALLRRRRRRGSDDDEDGGTAEPTEHTRPAGPTEPAEPAEPAESAETAETADGARATSAAPAPASDGGR